MKPNGRIRELATKCYKTGPLGKDGWPEYTSFDEQKFAELIVKECAKHAEHAKGMDVDYQKYFKELFSELNDES
jgi:hypothetical protein